VCHGPKPDRGARDYFRLDVYADTDGKLGAYSMRERILERAVVRGNMPPGTSLGPNGKEMLRLWVWQGAPER
jgi:aromatic ring-cleaving dioxygenase